jgi:hypothetical protein
MHSGTQRPGRQAQFKTLTASELYCPQCRTAQPVRERLLLVLPRGELHEFRCRACGASLATRTVTNGGGGVELAR